MKATRPAPKPTGRRYRSVRALIVGERLPKAILRRFDRLLEQDRTLQGVGQFLDRLCDMTSAKAAIEAKRLLAKLNKKASRG